MIRLNRIEKSLWLLTVAILFALAPIVAATPTRINLALALFFAVLGAAVWIPKPGRDWRGRFVAKWNQRFERC